jgi:hypothetical protein
MTVFKTVRLFSRGMDCRLPGWAEVEEGAFRMAGVPCSAYIPPKEEYKVAKMGPLFVRNNLHKLAFYLYGILFCGVLPVYKTQARRDPEHV